MPIKDPIATDYKVVVTWDKKAIDFETGEDGLIYMLIDVNHPGLHHRHQQELQTTQQFLSHRTPIAVKASCKKAKSMKMSRLVLCLSKPKTVTRKGRKMKCCKVAFLPTKKTKPVITTYDSNYSNAKFAFHIASSSVGDFSRPDSKGRERNLQDAYSL